MKMKRCPSFVIFVSLCLGTPFSCCLTLLFCLTNVPYLSVHWCFMTIHSTLLKAASHPCQTDTLIVVHRKAPLCLM